MSRTNKSVVLATITSLALLIFAGIVRAATFDESVLGDLSNSQSAPTTLSFSPGLNRVIGNVNGAGDSQDWITFNIPLGYTLSSEVLATYTSVDGQGFTGFHSGTSFLGNAGIPGSYNGYSHFGTAAQNGALPPVNLVGQDLLPVMADPNQAQGSTGFTFPLGAGDYTFLFQQLGSSTGYEFDFTVVAVPEPTALALASLAFGLRLFRRQRVRSR